MLRQIYVKGSLKNVKEGDKVTGFTLSMKNKLGTATLKGEVILTVGGQQIPADSVEIRKGETKMMAADLVQTPLKFSVGDQLDVTVKKEGGLVPGAHKVEIKVPTVEFGRCQFDVTDNVVT